MEYISSKDIHLKKATRITSKTLESNIYAFDNKAYKMYKKLKFYPRIMYLYQKEAKALIISESTASQIVKPDAIIYGRRVIDGIRMDYVENTRTLYEFSRVYNDLAKYLIVGNNASLGLKEIHRDPRNIVVSDLNFFNILFDENLETYYVDADSYEVDGYPSTTNSQGFDEYCRVRGIKEDTSQKSDRFLFMFEFLSNIFGTNIENIPTYRYDELAEQVASLKNMREYFRIIKKSKKIPNIPYVCDLIDKSDFNKTIEFNLPIINCQSTIKHVKELTR